ncbi:MAG: TonB family protein, partial [Pedobacter sp.]
LRYPAEAIANRTQGKVFLSFIVETDGELGNIRIDRRLGSGTDEEAVRILAASPKWIPALKDGKEVRVKYNIPIGFSLNKPISPSPVNVETLLQGKVQGLRIDSNAKAPGMKGSVSIYGLKTIQASDKTVMQATSPLYVIDGVKQKRITDGTSPLSTIPQKNIASIEVLKDETSTELYGEDGKYGVIVITTIKDKRTTKPAERKKVTIKPTAKADSKPADVKVYDFVSLEKQPEFVGGMAKFYEYLKKTVKYPAEAQKNNVSGKVFVTFVVEKDGTLTDIKVIRKLGSGLDEEAIRVMKASPKWTPGRQDGKAVRVKYNIPLSFSLSQ